MIKKTLMATSFLLIFNMAYADPEYHKMTLQTCNFKNANLSRATFERAYISGCDFTGAKLSETNFNFAVLENCSENGKPVTKEWLLEQGAKNVETAKIL